MSIPLESMHDRIEAKPDVAYVENDMDNNATDMFKSGAIEAERAEHEITVLDAVRAYPMACFWAFIMSFCIIMESFDVFLMGNFLALPAFANRYGVYDAAKDKYVVTTHWQQALQVSGQLGALIGVLMSGTICSRLGYRKSVLIGLMALNGFIFVSFFANSLPIFFVGQLLEGLPWGIFIGLAPAYCSEIVPIQLRAVCTQMLQMFWAIGSIIVGGATYHYSNDLRSEAYRIPLALQWMFPTPLFIIMWFAPESPWWLVRRGKYDEARKSVARLARKSLLRSDPSETVAMIRRTVELEQNEKPPSYIELFKGSDLRRTLIVSGVYAAQNLTGNLIANQAVYFFEQAGMTTKTAFALGLITSALQMIFVMLSWIMTTYFGRRPLYVYGNGFNCLLLIALGIAASVPSTHNSQYAQASLGLIISVLFTFTAAPVSYTIIGETSAIRLRPLTTGTGRAVYYIIEIPCIFLASYMLNPTGGNLGGKCGYVWGGTALFVTIMAYFFIPEMKDRSYRELDILFRRGVSARKFKETEIGVEENE